LAKIALKPTGPVLAQTADWTVSDIVCTAGPHDHPFEERHERPTIAVVIAGTFQYRSHTGSELMTPGSLMLGSAGASFECSHQHGQGDRCISFWYAPEFFDRLAHDAGARPQFRGLRLPPLRTLSPLVAKTRGQARRSPGFPEWEELAIQLAQQTLQLDLGLPSDSFRGEPGAVARVTRVLRMIESRPEAPHQLNSLAAEARLSPYHFLRTFQRLTGVTPHQYLLRMRLREAAVRLSTEPAKILDIAYDCGFGDISNFVRTFRAEFGVSPRAYSLRSATSGSTRMARTAGTAHATKPVISKTAATPI
jgi:AraC-like DNA-binding protein